MSEDKPLVYTDVDTWEATLADRWHVIRLMWKVSAQPDIQFDARWRLRWLVIKHYVFTRHPMVSNYIWSRG